MRRLEVKCAQVLTYWVCDARCMVADCSYYTNNGTHK